MAAPAVARGRAASRFHDLGLRVLAGAVLGPVLLVGAWFGSVGFVALVAGLALAASLEFAGLARARRVGVVRGPLYVAAVALPIAVFLAGPAAQAPGILLLFGLIVVWRLRSADVDGALAGTGVTMLGVLYVPWLLTHLVLLREWSVPAAVDGRPGFHLVTLTFVLVWVADTAAYLVGSWIGRTKIAPRVSPGKSLEGALGALVCNALAAWAYAHAFLDGVLLEWEAALLGAVASLVGLGGDLLESALKRDAGVKDASQRIPGHGGVLDRFDSMLFVAPLVYYALRWRLGAP